MSLRLPLKALTVKSVASHVQVPTNALATVLYTIVVLLVVRDPVGTLKM